MSQPSQAPVTPMTTHPTSNEPQMPAGRCWGPINQSEAAAMTVDEAKHGLYKKPSAYKLVKATP